MDRMTNEVARGDTRPNTRFVEARRLWNAFDPMGVIAPGGPQDDYDAYVDPILRLCEQGGDTDALRAYATYVVYETIGMHRQPVMDHAIAEFSKCVRKWYASGAAGSAEAR
jgi:hypothetical protein